MCLFLCAPKVTSRRQRLGQKTPHSQTRWKVRRSANVCFCAIVNIQLLFLKQVTNSWRLEALPARKCAKLRRTRSLVHSYFHTKPVGMSNKFYESRNLNLMKIYIINLHGSSSYKTNQKLNFQLEDVNCHLGEFSGSGVVSSEKS